MNILFISYDGMTDPLGQSQVLPYLSGLSKLGYRIFLISMEKTNRFQQHNLTIKHICDQHNIEWYPLKYRSGIPIFSGFLNIQTLYAKAKEVVKKSHIHLIHGRAAVATLVALKIKNKFGIPFIFDMRGFWADEKLDGNLWNLGNPLHRFAFNYFKQKEKELLLNATHVISLTHKGKEIILSQPLFNKLKVTVIPCCADLDFFDYRNVDQSHRVLLRKELGIDEHALVMNYLGSWGTWYMPREMMYFFSRLLVAYPDAIFMIMSQDDEEKIKKDAALFHIPDKNLVIKSVVRNEVPFYLSAADFAIFFIKPVYSKQASSPTKMGEIMGMGLPLICNAGVGDVEEIMKDAKGVVVKEFDEKTLDHSLNRILTLIKSDKNVNRNCALKVYSLKDGIEKYAKVYASVLNDGDKDGL
ncbi:MAG: glycosyltransferase [Flavobacteriales bacterium]